VSTTRVERLDEGTLRAAFDPGVRELPPPRGRFPTNGAEPVAAAIVVPIVLDADVAGASGSGAHIVAVVRAATLRDHAGEVGFPGGKREPHDADLAETALREAREELGFAEGDLSLLGALTPMPVITGRFWVHPYAALVRTGASPRITSTEHARLIEIPVMSWLRGEKTIEAVETTWRDVPMRVPHFRLDGCVMYGASACTLYETLARIAGAMGRTLPEPRLTLRPPWGDRYKQYE
jgi:8-oxo-dGTP pyrophosphatase MutT (NUDIX family)